MGIKSINWEEEMDEEQFKNVVSGVLVIDNCLNCDTPFNCFVSDNKDTSSNIASIAKNL